MKEPQLWKTRLVFFIMGNMHWLVLIIGIVGLAMLVYKVSPECPQCEKKNKIGANYCNECGAPISNLAIKLKEEQQ